MKYAFVIFLVLGLLLVGQAFSLQREKSDTVSVTPNDTRPAPRVIENVKLIDVHKAWNLYNPPTFDPEPWRPEIPSLERLENAMILDRSMIVQLRLGTEINDLKEKVIQDSTDLQSMNKLGVLYAENGFYKMGRYWFTRILRIDSAYCPAYTNLGNIDYENSDLEKAKKNYQLAINFCPDLPETFYNLSLVEYKNGNLADYQIYYERYKQLNPAESQINILPAVTAPVEGMSKKAAEAETLHPMWVM